MLWDNSGWEILQKHNPLLFPIPVPFQVLLCLLRYPKSMLIIARMWDFFTPNYIDIISSVYLFIQMAVRCREICVFITHLRLESGW